MSSYIKSLSILVVAKYRATPCNSYIPSWELTYPTIGKGISSSNVPIRGDMLASWRVHDLPLAPAQIDIFSESCIKV